MRGVRMGYDVCLASFGGVGLIFFWCGFCPRGNVYVYGEMRGAMGILVCYMR